MYRIIVRISLFLYSCSAFAASEMLLDRVVAVVNGSPVLYSEIMEKITRGLVVSISEYPAESTDNEYLKALQDQINRELIMQEARELEIDVREEEVESEVKNFLESRGLNKENLVTHLATQNMTYADYLQDFRDQMILRRFQGRVIAPLIKITDKDIETYYLKTIGASSDVVELVLRQIIFSANNSADIALIQQKKQIADEAFEKLKNGMLFEDAVKIFSDDSRARETGGLMAGIHARDLSESIRAKVELLEIGQITEPIRTSLGWHIFRLEAKNVTSNREFAERKKQIELELRSVELASQTKRWLEEQRQKSKIEIIDEKAENSSGS